VTETASNLSLDVAIGVTIPARDARGRAARIGPVLDSILSAHNYPPVVERLLAEALILTALLGSLLKDPQGQMTLQAQTENGAIDLLVCDYLGGELRGYVRHDPERLADLGPNPSLFALFGKGYLAITFDQPVSDGGGEPRAGGAELFRPVRADPEPGPAGGGEEGWPLGRRRNPVPAPSRRRGGP
jgi:molecular chaperone Hsp33